MIKHGVPLGCSLHSPTGCMHCKVRKLEEAKKKLIKFIGLYMSAIMGLYQKEW